MTAARICRYRAPDGATGVGVLAGDGSVRALPGVCGVADALMLARDGIDDRLGDAVAGARLLAPIDRHEVWAAGVTYVRSREARMEESAGAAAFYDRVYDAERPELFFKATPSRVAHPGDPVHVRTDSSWTVPEPELGLWLDPDLRLLGIGLGNDMSARDIEGENPLYLPQAKVYAACCALGPAVLATADYADAAGLVIRMRIRRADGDAFDETLRVASLKRPLEQLVEYLARDNLFPDGVVLLTGTGLVPPDDFSLHVGDEVEISADGIGVLANPVDPVA